MLQSVETMLGKYWVTPDLRAKEQYVQQAIITEMRKGCRQVTVDVGPEHLRDLAGAFAKAGYQVTTVLGKRLTLGWDHIVDEEVNNE